MAESEFELIARLLERLPPPGPRVRIPSGDDAAVTDHEGPLVISVDALMASRVQMTEGATPAESSAR